MKELLEKVKSLREAEDREQVQYLINQFDLMKERETNISIPTLEAVLKHYKNELRKILTEDLLEWMQENEQNTFETDDLKVNIRVHVSTKMLDSDKGFSWLQDREYGDLIKDTLDFPKGELTPEIEKSIAELGASYSKKTGIHPQSLKKIISDRLEAGEDLPDEDDGIHVGYFDECIVKEK